MEATNIAEFYKEPFTCGLCFDAINPFEIQVEMPCHNYCFNCWASWAKECVNVGKVPDIPCLMEGCTNALSCQLTIALVFEKEPATLIQYQTKSIYKSIQLPDRLVRCTGSCQSWWIADTSDCFDTKCPQCKVEICSNCTRPLHPAMSCEEYDKFIESPDNWISTFTKKCPKCVVDIQKNGGCNSMTCSQCNFVFCWMCRTPFGPEGNNHNECYNRMASEERILNATLAGTQENESTRLNALTGVLNTNRIYTRRAIQRMRNAYVRAQNQNRYHLRGAARFIGDSNGMEQLDDFAIDGLFDVEVNEVVTRNEDFDMTGLFDVEDVLPPTDFPQAQPEQDEWIGGLFDDHEEGNVALAAQVWGENQAVESAVEDDFEGLNLGFDLFGDDGNAEPVSHPNTATESESESQLAVPTEDESRPLTETAKTPTNPEHTQQEILPIEHDVLEKEEQQKATAECDARDVPDLMDAVTGENVSGVTEGNHAVLPDARSKWLMVAYSFLAPFYHVGLRIYTSVMALAPNNLLAW